MDEILDPKIENALALFDIPNPRWFIARSRDEESTIPREVKRVDLLHVALEEMANALLLDVPNLWTVSKVSLETRQTHPNLTIFSAGCEVFAIRAEAYATDVEIAGPICLLV